MTKSYVSVQFQEDKYDKTILIRDITTIFL